MLFLKTFGLCLIGMGALDAVWLSFATPRIYGPMMGDLLRPDTQWGPAVAFYLIFTLGLTQLVVLPAFTARLKDLGKSQLIFNAALYGLVAYATYNLSAWAVIKGWSGLLSVIDIGWGTFASTLTAAFAYFGLNLMEKGRTGQ